MNFEVKELSPEQLAQHPVLVVLLMGLAMLVMAFLVGAIVFWIWAALRLRRGIPVLTVQPWLPRVWGLADVAVAGVTMIFCQFMAVRIARDSWGLKAGDELQHDQMPSLMALLGLANLFWVVFAMLWIAARHRGSLEQLGFGIKNARANTVIGLVAAVATLPLIHLLMLAVTQGTNTQYNHPLINMMMENATVTAYLLGCFSAVLAAPLAEEFLFRVILQGWLQSIEFSRAHAFWIWGASEELRASSVEVEPTLFPIENDQVLPAAQGVPVDTNVNPFFVPRSSVVSTGNTASLWPVFIAGTLFGLAHYGYGLSYIPLTFMGIVLGLLFRATGSIIPSLIVHVTLNAFSMFALGVSILYQQAASAP